MQKPIPFLWFNDQAEEAAQFYMSVFPNSRILSVQRFGDEVPGPQGKTLTVTFEINGQELIGLNGGPQYKFSEAISLYVNCESQAEVDTYWDRLTADGGEPGPCGWLKDKYGLSWQIVPTILTQLMADPDRAKAQRVTEAMLKMGKIDVAALQRAYDGA